MARPRYVRPHPAIHRFLSPGRGLGTISANPFEMTINTSLAIRLRGLSQQGALTAIENP